MQIIERPKTRRRYFKVPMGCDLKSRPIKNFPRWRFLVVVIASLMIGKALTLGYGGALVAIGIAGIMAAVLLAPRVNNSLYLMPPATRKIFLFLWLATTLCLSASFILSGYSHITKEMEKFAKIELWRTAGGTGLFVVVLSSLAIIRKSRRYIRNRVR